MTPAPVPVVKTIEVMEELENQLCLAHGKDVIIVRPFFGTQSDSWAAYLTVRTTEYPITFEFVTAGRASTFTVNDVKSVEERNKLIITLKGPKDY